MRNTLLLTVLLFLFCRGQESKTETPAQVIPQSTKSVLMVIAPKDFRDEEFKEPYDLLTKSGIKVVIASTDTMPTKGMLGMVVNPQITLDQVNSESFDALVIVGGAGCQTLWDNATLHGIVQNFNANDKTIAAICIAPVVLARAGILREVKATVFPSVQDEITSCGAKYTGAKVEVDRNIITGSGPEAAKDFAVAISNSIKK